MEEIKIHQGLWRYRYKYRSQDNQHYILAFFELIDGVSCAKWSLYYCQEEQPLLEQTCTTEEFHNMMDSYQWQSEGYEVVVAK